MARTICIAVHGLENGGKASVGKKTNHRWHASHIQLGFHTCHGMYAIGGTQSFFYDEKRGVFLAAQYLF